MNVEKWHQAALSTDTAALISDLADHLGYNLVAHMAGSSHRQDVYRWARRGVEPRSKAYTRLLTAYRAYHMIAETHDPDTARAWLIGANPRLAEDSPADRIREGDYLAVITAAQAFGAAA